MKNLLRLFAIFSILFALVACEEKGAGDEPTPPNTEEPTPPENDDPTPPDNGDDDDNNNNEEPTPPEDDTIVLTEESVVNIYRQGYEGLGVDHYFFGLCDTHIVEVDGLYMPENKEGTLFWCSFYGEPTPDPTDPVLPEGTYTFNGNDKVAGNLDTYETYIARRNAGFTHEVVPVKDAVVVIEHTEEGYHITFEYTLESGEVIRARYDGTIYLQIGTPLTAPTPWMEKNYRAEFVGVYANLTGASYYTPEADVIGVQLYDVALDAENRQVGGIVVQLELTAPELEGENPMIPDGVYNVSMGTELYSTPVGDVLNMGGAYGGHTMFGTAARYMDENGDYSYAAFLTGTVTVTTEGDEQIIDVDLSTASSVSVKGRYKGAVTINNYTYTPPVVDESYSTLTGDKTVTANDNWIFSADYYVSYFNDRDDVSLIRFRGYSMDPNDFLNIPDSGFEGFRFDLVVENTGTLKAIPSGTYTPDSDGSHQPKTFLTASRESVDGGTRFLGSYGWMGYDWLGFIDPTRLAPLEGGALVLVDYGNNEYGIDYNVTDDKGNTITFSYRTEVNFVKQNSY